MRDKINRKKERRRLKNTIKGNLKKEMFLPGSKGQSKDYKEKREYTECNDKAKPIVGKKPIS